MAFFSSNPFYTTDSFFSDPYYTVPKRHRHSNYNDYSLENKIVNTLDNIFSNDLLDYNNENEEDDQSIPMEMEIEISNENLPKSQSMNHPRNLPKNQKFNKKEIKRNNINKDVKLSNWINNYKVFHPKIDVSEGEKNYIIHADLPGMKKEDVKLDLTDGLLTISGERKNELKESSINRQNYRIERNFGKFKRSFTLPEDVNLNSIQAKMENGVLEVNINKKEIPKKEVRQIQIQ